MNILLAIAIFWGINYAQGKYLRATTEIGYVVTQTAAEKVGFQVGDKILSINGRDVTHWDEILSLLYIQNVGHEITLEIERSGSRQILILPPGSIPDIASERFGILPAHTAAMIGNVEVGKPADQLGLKPRDILVSLNGIAVFNENQVIQIIRANRGKEVKVVWKRGEDIMEGNTVPNEEGRIGVTVGSLYVGPTLHLKYSFFGAFPEGMKDIIQASALVYKSILQLISGKTSFAQSFGGPIKIAQIATLSAEGGLASYLAFMALLSMSLAILNIIPFPALDGGHLIVMLLEAVFGREIPHKVKLAIQQAGFVILLVFMAFVIYNDIMNF